MLGQAPCMNHLCYMSVNVQLQKLVSALLVLAKRFAFATVDQSTVDPRQFVLLIACDVGPAMTRSTHKGCCMIL